MTLLAAKHHALTFGAYIGKTLAEVAEKDPTYIDWLAGQTWPDLFLNEALPVICAHYGRTPKKSKAKANTQQMGLGI